MTQNSGDLVGRLAFLETGLVSDVLDESGHTNQVLSANLRSLSADVSIAGRAVRAESLMPMVGLQQLECLYSRRTLSNNLRKAAERF
jgi:hypothetical protein